MRKREIKPKIPNNDGGKNTPAGLKRKNSPRADAATRAAAKLRREKIFDYWCRGVNPTRVSEREGIPLSTVKDDFNLFAKEAADNAEVEHKRARAEMLIVNEIASAEADLEHAGAEDAKGRAALHMAKFKGIELYAKINGLLVDKLEHSGKVEIADPRLAAVLGGMSDDELRDAIRRGVRRSPGARGGA